MVGTIGAQSNSMKCGHCRQFDHKTYPRHATLGMGFCQIGALPGGGTSPVKVFRHWTRDTGCGRGILLAEDKRQPRRDWIAALDTDT